MTNLLLCTFLLVFSALGKLPTDEAKDGLPQRPFWLDAERAVRLPGGDWIVYRYGTMSDSGVQVFRMDAVMSKERWRAECKELGVSHSKYYHKAEVDIKNNEVIVTSIANHGHGRSFEERLNVETGKQISRTTK